MKLEWKKVLWVVVQMSENIRESVCWKKRKRREVDYKGKGITARKDEEEKATKAIINNFIIRIMKEV